MSFKSDGGEGAHSQPLPAFDQRLLSLLWALEHHAGVIARLHGTLFPEAWDQEAVAKLLNHPGSIALLAAQGGESAIGGFALAQVAADEAEILTIGVAPEWRRKGVARRLVDGIVRAAQRSGANTLFLEVADGNAAARGLYEALGFQEVGRRKGYYQPQNGPAEDAIVMRKALG
ncbi:MAG: ribosomal protein S18-alanine N-acetyltransferase [Hyphomicrobiaceae bacterium]